MHNKVNIKVVFDGVAQSALSATRRLSGELKQFGAESKRASAALAGIGKGMMKGLESGATFGTGAMVGYNQFVAPMLKAAETYEEAVTRATVAFMNAQGKTSENFPKLVALAEKLSVDYAGSAKNFLEVATTLRQGQVKEDVILKAGLKAVALNKIQKKVFDFIGDKVAGWMSENPKLTLTGGVMGAIGSGVATYFGAMKGKEFLSKLFSGGGAGASGASVPSLLVDAMGRPISSASIGSQISRASGLGGRALSFIGRLNPYLMAVSTGVTAYSELMREGVSAEDVKNMQVRAASESGGRYLPTELQINYQPTVTIQTAEARETEKFLKMLNEHKDHLAKLVGQVQTRNQTIAFTR
jgi:hypothetical protein